MERRAAVEAVMAEATRRGFTFGLVTVEDLAGRTIGQAVALLDDQGEHLDTLASLAELAELGRFLGVVPGRAAVAA